ncbi:MAG: hypothetical protein ABGY24_02915, partial [bacterium]
MPPRRKAVAGKSRLGPGKAEAAVPNGQGILQFFDSKKKVSVHEAGACGACGADGADGADGVEACGATGGHEQKENVAFGEGRPALTGVGATGEKRGTMRVSASRRVRKGGVGELNDLKELDDLKESKEGANGKGSGRRPKRH